MSEIIAGIRVPTTAVATAATVRAQQDLSPLLFHHSRRVFLFAALHARALDIEPDPELLYLAALFHDAGLRAPATDEEQRFELDGADHARRFLTQYDMPVDAADLVWSAVAWHTTPAIPLRMGPEVATLHLGVLTDAVGARLELLDPGAVDEIVAAHPRGAFKDPFLREIYDGVRHRPATAYGTSNADVLAHFDPTYRRPSMVERVLRSPWPS